jgi:hypothetical protein
LAQHSNKNSEEHPTLYDYEPDEEENIERFIKCVPGFLFPLKTYRLIQERDWLPRLLNGERIKYEIHQTRMLMNVIVSDTHDVAANTWNVSIGQWSQNGGRRKTLRQVGQARMSPF